MKPSDSAHRGALRLPVACLSILALTACGKEAPEGGASSPGQPQSAAGATAKPGIRTTVHRKDAGEPDSTGWCLARSTEGRFSVRLPTSFNDSTVTMPAEAGVIVMADSIAAHTEHDTSFTAVRTRRSDGKILISSLDEIAERLKKERRLKSQESITVLGQPALEIRTEDGGRIGLLRSLKIEGALYQLGVEYAPKTAPTTIDADVAKFFDSFRILGEDEE